MISLKPYWEVRLVWWNKPLVPDYDTMLNASAHQNQTRRFPVGIVIKHLQKLNSKAIVKYS